MWQLGRILVVRPLLVVRRVCLLLFLIYSIGILLVEIVSEVYPVGNPLLAKKI